MADKTETILENIKTAVEDIDGTGDYNLSLATVSRRLKHWATMRNSEFPAAFILYSDEAFEPFAMTMGAGSRSQSTFTVLIRGYVHISDGELETQITSLRQDVIRAILDDETQGGIAIETRPLSISVMEGWQGNEFKVAVIDIRFQVIFIFDTKNP